MMLLHVLLMLAQSDHVLLPPEVVVVGGLVGLQVELVVLETGVVDHLLLGQPLDQLVLGGQQGRVPPEVVRGRRGRGGEAVAVVVVAVVVVGLRGPGVVVVEEDRAVVAEGPKKLMRCFQRYRELNQTSGGARNVDFAIIFRFHRYL